MTGIDLARGAAVLAVVLFHSVRIVGPVAGAPSTYGYVNYLLGLVRMPVLMLVSGVLAGRLLAPMRGEAAAMRAVKLGWIFLAWLPVSLGLRWALDGEAPTPLVIAAELVGPRSDFWYIWALALLAATLPLVRRLGFLATCALALAASVAAFSNWVPVRTFSQRSLLEFALFFYLGAFGRDLAVTAAAKVESHAPLALAGVAAALAAAAATHAARPLLPAMAGAPWSVVEAATACAATLGAACVVARWRMVSMPLVWIGRRTLPIYLAHSPLLLLAVRAGWWRLAHPALAPALFAAAVVPATLLLEWAMRAMNAGFVYTLPTRIEDAARTAIRRGHAAFGAAKTPGPRWRDRPGQLADRNG